MLYEKGLAYQAEALVNYDPVDKTVLANEQVGVMAWFTHGIQMAHSWCRSMPMASLGAREQRSRS